MAGTKFKWKFAFFSYLILVNVCTNSLPISSRLPEIITTDTIFKHSEVPEIQDAVERLKDRAAALTEHDMNLAALKEHEDLPAANITAVNNSTRTKDRNTTVLDTGKALLRQNVRPGQEVRLYAIELTVNGNSFRGRAVLDVILTLETREDPIELNSEGLAIESVLAGVFSAANVIPADFNLDDDILEINPVQIASSYVIIIEYTGNLQNTGFGFYRGEYNDFNYLAMNLHPTHARRVFPCMDEPTEASMISFTFNGIEYNNLMSNSMLEENSQNQFRSLPGPPHIWSMIAHNFNNINVPTAGVFLYVRPGVSNQESQASVTLNNFYLNLNEWTNKPYFEIMLNQATQLSVLALPDVSRNWIGLSIIPIWEPYILMENTCSVKQRFTAMVKIGEGLARQWFGQVIYPENWRYEWVVSGLTTYAAYDILKDFQHDPVGIDISLLDVDTLFVTEIIQESLYHDGYSSALTLEIDEDLFDEDAIRDYIYGNHLVKAPALFRMFRLVLGDDSQDFIQEAGRALLVGRALETVNSLNFMDAINSGWLHSGNGAVDDIGDYMQPWLENNGYPLIHIGLRQGGVLVTQERFGFTSQPHVAYNVPITYTVSNNPDYDNIYPIEMMEGTMTFNMFLDEENEDFVLFNIQGQGYYRVNYDNDLWERIISALDDPDRRDEIHPLNRATLVDDALNLARAGRIDYEIAFLVVLTMEHETEYAPWKAFVRNMSFLRKRLEAMVDDDEDLDPDIYLRMVRRTIVAFEDEIGFTPDPLINEPAMTSLTRGLVMDHACRAGYQPCIAAAVDWFYDPNNGEVVNPNIPSEIRPAVYCAMVREGDDDVIGALYDRLEIEPSMWERVVILESLACSRDDGFLMTLLEETVAVNSPYTTEERVRIFKAVADASYQSAWVAQRFLSLRTNEIRNMYGGAEKLEEVIKHFAESMPDADLSNEFNIFVYAQNNNLDDSQLVAERAAALVLENLQWQNQHLDYIYEWIDENDAPTLFASLILISLSFVIALFNH